jgi:hypothetical protein
MLSWLKQKLEWLKQKWEWFKEKGPPPPIRKFKEKNPRAFKALIILLIIIPMGITALVAFNAFLWLFYLR